MSETSFETQSSEGVIVLRLHSSDGTNRLTRASVVLLMDTLAALRHRSSGLVIRGNRKFFSAGAELEEIGALNGGAGYEFAALGQRLMMIIETFPAPVCAAISGYCMGGGLDLALACHQRIAAPNSVFGHRGAALGLVTGWGGTQRLPRLIGSAEALRMLVAAEKVSAPDALSIGLVDAVAEDPVAEAIRRIRP